MESLLPNASIPRVRRSIEDFRGNFEDLALFMQRSWAENKSQPLLYTPEFLASYFSYPGASFGLAPTIYEGSKIVGFVAGFPRRMRYNGKELKIIVTAFLTVASDHKKSGYGIVVWSELVNRARASGYAGVMSYAVAGDPMSDMMLGCYQRMGIPASRVAAIPYLTRFTLFKQTTLTSENVELESITSFMFSANRLSNSVPLARVWSPEEAEWQCRGRLNSIMVSHSPGERRGFLTGYIMEIADRDRTKCVLIEDVLWNDLTGDDRQELVRKFVARSASADVKLAVVPLLGYADPEPFIKARFLRSARVLHAYLGLLTERLEPEPLSSIYVDVF